MPLDSFALNHHPYSMKFLLSLIVVLSLLVAPFVAQAAAFCDEHHCASSLKAEDGTSSKSQPDGGKMAQADDCCVHCHSVSVTLVTGGADKDFSKVYKVAFLNSAVLSGQDPQGLLRPPQAA